MSNRVGILGAEVYFPSTFIDMEDLEMANKVSKGKYTIGLGQMAMAFTGDREDINSISLSVVSSLLEKYDIDPLEVGHLEVGTETLVDKSKSTKTVLMDLFAPSGNHDVEGATCINACYGGTAALLNALAWCDSSAWDGRYAIVVAADIAVYAKGPARPTGGCGAVALLIGRNAPLVVDLRSRATFATNVWDFFKPKMDSEYPEVDGALSEACYLEALDSCYSLFVEKQAACRAAAAAALPSDVVDAVASEADTSNMGLVDRVLSLLLTPAPLKDELTAMGKAAKAAYPVEGVHDVDYFLFHSPYNKLVQKSFARVLYHDIRAGRKLDSDLCGAGDVSEVASQWKDTPLADTYKDKVLEGKMKELSRSYYDTKVAPGCDASKLIGNTYTASVYLNLAWLVSQQGASLAGKNMVLFSYGSGALATMFSLRPNATTTGRHGKFSLANMARQLDMASRLGCRVKRDPADLDAALDAREACDVAPRPFIPTYSTHSMGLGTYFLAGITDKNQRQYLKKVVASAAGSPEYGSPTRASLSSGNLVGDEGRSRSITDDFNTVSSTTQRLVSDLSDTTGEGGNGREGEEDSVPALPNPRGGISRNKTYVWASGRPNVRVVVTGVAAALPGRDSNVFTPGVNNIHRIIKGENFITEIPVAVKDNMLEKNVVLLKKNRETGVNTKVPVSTHAENINVCASLGAFDLTTYGVTDSIASTMDVSVQVAVAAGLEALKDAGIVSGDEETGGWVLPENLQATTGVVYATSFPALDSTIAEVSRFFKTQMASAAHAAEVVDSLREKLCARLPAGEALSAQTETALQALAEEAAAAAASTEGEEPVYEFDRKFLFRMLVLGNAQLAQIIKARGPNMQTNAACAGSTQAVALAFDMIQVGRAERMIVVAGDNAASDTLMPWLGNGFRALGAATTCAQVELAAIPFDRRRKGMILGAGGIGMVLESEEGAKRRYSLVGGAAGGSPGTFPALQRRATFTQRPQAFKCRLLSTLFSNSAYHGASLDKEHIASEMERFVASVEKEQGISRKDLARHGVYFSHETSTYASPTSSCASNELHGLRQVFGEDFKHMLILNTKGFTGHPMGVSFEDVVAAEVLTTGLVPPIANFSEADTDPNLGIDLKLSRGGAYPCKYAIRFAAGFGSQIALALYGSPDTLPPISEP
jgi:hydroxymethylglutaryl-CoA synthase